MAVRIKQVWGNLEVSFINDVGERAVAYVNITNVTKDKTGTYWLTGPGGGILVEAGETARVVVPSSFLGGSFIQAQPGDTLMMKAEHGPWCTSEPPYTTPIKREDSNVIIYQALVVPIEVIGAGVGAVIGGVVGYVLKPLGPEVSALIGVGLGGGGGYGLAYVATTGIPEIPIPTFGATPEGPGAPARLGKYQITG